MKHWYVYLLQCSDDSLYCGSTNDLDRRVAEHQAGKGGAYTRSRLPVKLKAWMGPLTNRSTAQRFEAKVKRLPRDEKLRAFIKEVAPWLLDKNSPQGTALTAAPKFPLAVSATPVRGSIKKRSKGGSTHSR